MAITAPLTVRVHRLNTITNSSAPTERHNRLRNDDPDLVGIFGGWGTWSGPGSRGREPTPIL
jgi:hypothetical protein